MLPQVPEDISRVLRIVLSLGAELMSFALAVKLLWKAAVLDVILINTLYFYVAL